MKSATAVVHASRNQYHLYDVGSVPGTRARSASPNGLIEDQDVMAVVYSGTADGPITVTVRLCDVEPPIETDPAWTEIVEISHRITSGELAVIDPFGALRSDLPILHTKPGAWCRIRVYARGRDTANDQVIVNEPIEEHAVHIWLAGPSPSTVHRAADGVGRIFRRE